MSIECLFASTCDVTQYALVAGPGGRGSLLGLLLSLAQCYSLLVPLSLYVILVGLTTRTGDLAVEGLPLRRRLNKQSRIKSKLK